MLYPNTFEIKLKVDEVSSIPWTAGQNGRDQTAVRIDVLQSVGRRAFHTGMTAGERASKRQGELYRDQEGILHEALCSEAVKEGTKGVTRRMEALSVWHLRIEQAGCRYYCGSAGKRDARNSVFCM